MLFPYFIGKARPNSVATGSGRNHRVWKASTCGRLDEVHGIGVADVLGSYLHSQHRLVLEKRLHIAGVLARRVPDLCRPHIVEHQVKGSGNGKPALASRSPRPVQETFRTPAST